MLVEIWGVLPRPLHADPLLIQLIVILGPSSFFGKKKPENESSRRRRYYAHVPISIISTVVLRDMFQGLCTTITPLFYLFPLLRGHNAHKNLGRD